MVIGDVLQRVFDALNEILLADRRHGELSASVSGALASTGDSK
jgi:hypothetical protein